MHGLRQNELQWKLWRCTTALSFRLSSQSRHVAKSVPCHPNAAPWHSEGFFASCSAFSEGYKPARVKRAACPLLNFDPFSVALKSCLFMATLFLPWLAGQDAFSVLETHPCVQIDRPGKLLDQHDAMLHGILERQDAAKLLGTLA